MINEFVGSILVVNIFYLSICLALLKLKNKGPAYLLFSVANFIGFCMLGFFYFYSFDIQWGLAWQEVIISLPLLAGMVFLIIDTIFMIKKKNWKLGLRGYGIGWAAFLCTVLILIFFSNLIVVEPHNGHKETENTEENRILELVLNDVFDESSGHVIIDTKIYWHFKDYTSENYESIKKGILKFYQKNNPNSAIIQSINGTFNKWVELNPKAPHLTIKSSPQDGYYIAFGGSFLRYINHFELRWDRWYLPRLVERPSVDISLPAYDLDTGIIIMYIGMQYDPSMGIGTMYVFRYQDDELKELIRYEIWVS